MTINLTLFPNLNTWLNAAKAFGATLKDGLSEKELKDCEHFASEGIRLADLMKETAKQLGSEELARGLLYDNTRWYVNKFGSKCLKMPASAPTPAPVAQPNDTHAFWATTPFQVLGTAQRFEKTVADIDQNFGRALNSADAKIVAGAAVLVTVGASVLRFVASRGAVAF